MSADPNSPVLTNATGMGGVVAQEGFDYQLWDGLARLPTWLTNPAFEQMIFEGLEDLEARFFAPQAPRHWLLERFQAKSGYLGPAEIMAVLESFRRFETAYPRAARVQTLVIPRLPATLAWLGRDPERVRQARPFYAPFADVVEASDAKLKSDLEQTFGAALGEFVADGVEFSERNIPDRDSASVAFGLALGRAFPVLDIGSGRVQDAFERLSSLLRSSIGRPLARDVLIRTIEAGLGVPLPLPTVFTLHLRSDRNEVNQTALEIDASQFSGSGTLLPAPQAWREDLLAPLERTATWLRGRGVSRVALSGSYRLSTAMVLGWSLRSAIGFELEIPTRAGVWATDDRPIRDDDAPAVELREASSLQDGQIVVALGVIRNPAADLAETISVPTDSVLGVHLPAPLTSGKAVQASVSAIKRAVDVAVTRLRPRGIKLYIAGPAGLAVALGHRWNGMPPTQLHEFITTSRQYRETARL